MSETSYPEFLPHPLPHLPASDTRQQSHPTAEDHRGGTGEEPIDQSARGSETGAVPDEVPGVIRSRRQAKAEPEILSLHAVADLPTRQVRILINQTYRLLDSDHPPAGTAQQYALLAEELEARAERAARPMPGRAREAFRDAPLYRRFELIIDGTVAAYLRYDLVGGRLFLLDAVVKAGHYTEGIDRTLMHHVLLNAHKRRLRVIPRSVVARRFLAENPRYQALTSFRISRLAEDTN